MKAIELPEAERPAYRQRYFGTDGLSNAELLQLITSAGESEAALSILSAVGGLVGLQRA